MAVYAITVFFIKFTILLQYLRIFVPLKQHNVMFRTCHILIWLHLFFYLLCFFFVVFSCEPVNKYWKPWISGHCLDIFAMTVATAIINLVSDIVIMILPQTIIWKLQISIKRKIGLSTVILFGVLWVQKVCPLWTQLLTLISSVLVYHPLSESTMLSY